MKGWEEKGVLFRGKIEKKQKNLLNPGTKSSKQEPDNIQKG